MLKNLKKLLYKFVILLKINLVFILSYSSTAHAAYDITKISYTGDSFKTALTVTDVTFNNDGTVMYLADDATDMIRQYNLATAFDITTAAFNGQFDHALFDTDVKGITFNNDGSKMYLVGEQTSLVWEFDLILNFNVVGAAFNGAILDLTGLQFAPDVIVQPNGLIFNDDGSKLYVVDADTDKVFEITLTTQYDVGDPILNVERLNIAAESTAPSDIAFNQNGTKFFILDRGNKSLFEYSLTVAYDLTTFTGYTGNSFNFTTEENFPEGFEFNSDGSKIFMVGTGDNDVFAYDVDETSPTLSSSSPSDDATDVAVDTNIVLNFSEAVDVESGDIVIKKTSDDSVVEAINVTGGLVSGSGTTQITVNPTADLEAGVEYYVVIDATAFDDSVSNSYAGITSTTALSFTTSSSGSSGSLPNPTNDKDVVGSIEAQVESAKTSLFSSLNTVSNRLSYLRRNRSNDNLANNGIDFKFSNKMLASINDATSETQNELLDFLPKDWSLWTAGEISVHSFGDESNKSSREIDAGSISLGVDKKINDNQLYGFAIQYVDSEADIGSSGTSVDSENISLSIYGTKPHNDDQFIEGLIGVGKIDSDLKRVSGVNTLTGQRDGQQIFSSINYGKRIEKDNRNITPLVKLNLGYTELDEYSETGTNALKYHKQTFETGLISTGFEIDQISEFKNSTFKPYGALDYSLDFGSSSSAKMNYVSDSSTIYTYSSGGNSTNYLNALIGFDYSNQKGLSVNSSYKRKQGDNSEKADIFNFGLNFVTKRETEYALRLDQEEKLYSELNIGKNINGFDFSFNTNQIILQNPRPETNISISSKF
ncbi:autotransporter domain-containing protein [Candidatus Pelagibacter ubique]|nr:autotransporter domain-containing protein [Candidatus Pelagibacter ubique]